MKKKALQIALAIILLADMLFIFLNSAKDAGESGEISSKVTEMIAEIVVPDFDGLSADEQAVAVKRLDGIVRECAHLLQFVPIGFALFALLFTVNGEKKRIPILAALTVGFGCLYALSDEIHQYFVPGRAFQLLDIGLDTAGVVIGCAVSWGICALYLRLNGRKSGNKQAV